MGDILFLKVSQLKGVRWFNIRGRLNPGPDEIIEKLNLVAYRFDLLVELEHVHNVFHISQLKKYVSNPNYVIKTEPEKDAEI